MPKAARSPAVTLSQLLAGFIHSFSVLAHVNIFTRFVNPETGHASSSFARHMQPELLQLLIFDARQDLI